MPNIKELSERWTQARKVWIEMNRKAVEFGKVLLENWKTYFDMGPEENLVEPVPPDPQKVSQIVGPQITTDPKSHRLADWMSEQFDVADAIKFSQERRRFGMGVLMMVPSQEGPPDFVPFFFEFMNKTENEYVVNLMGVGQQFVVDTTDPDSFKPLFDHIAQMLETRYPQSIDEMIEMFSGRQHQVGFRPRFD